MGFIVSNYMQCEMQEIKNTKEKVYRINEKEKIRSKGIYPKI